MKRISNKMYIYALINPINETIFYIGQSKNVYIRILGHINLSYLGKTPKDNIITEICKAGLFPKHKILEEIDVDLNNKISILNVCEREKYWINYYSKSKKLSNLQLCDDITFEPNIIERTIKCKYCGKDIKAKTTKKLFCDDKCRIYFKRELDRGTLKEVKITDVNIPTNTIQNITEEKPKTNYTINTTKPKFNNKIEEMFWEEKQKIINSKK